MFESLCFDVHAKVFWLGPFFWHLFRCLCSEQHFKMYAFSMKVRIILASFDVAKLYSKNNSGVSYCY